MILLPTNVIAGQLFRVKPDNILAALVAGEDPPELLEVKSGEVISEVMNAKAGRPPLSILPNSVVELCHLRNAAWLNGKRADVSLAGSSY